MSRPRQSRALIIVNTDFCSSDGDMGLRPRRGARREAEKLSRVLAQLSYRVKLLHNRTAKEMEDLYQQGEPPHPLPAPSSRLQSALRCHPKAAWDTLVVPTSHIRGSEPETGRPAPSRSAQLTAWELRDGCAPQSAAVSTGITS